MLTQVLKELQSTQGTLSLGELGQRLGVERSALEGMIQFWVRKGRLQLEGADLEAAFATEGCQGACGATCPGPAECPLYVKLPRTYAVKFELND